MKGKFKQTEIGKIPEDWEIKELSNICEKIIDCSHAKKPDFLDNGDYIFLEVSNIGNDGFLNLEEKKFVSKEDYDGWTKRLIPQENDIVITKTGRVGASSIIPAKIKCCIGRNQVILRANSKIVEPHFLWHFLHSSIYKNELKKQTMTGTILESLHVKYIPKIKIAFPKINEQKKIVSFLDAISYKIKLLQKQNKTLEEIGQAIFKHWFVDFEFPDENGKPYKSSGGEMVKSELGEIPKGWEVKKLDKLGDFKNGINYDRNEVGDSEYYIVNVRDIVANRLLAKYNLGKLKINSKKAEPYLINKQDILIVRSASPGEIALVFDNLENIIYSGFIIRFRVDKLNNLLYILYFLDNFKAELINLSDGTTLKNINQVALKNFKVVIPKEQIIKKFNLMINPVFDKTCKLNLEIRYLQKTRDLLLPKLMSGEVRVL